MSITSSMISAAALLKNSPPFTKFSTSISKNNEIKAKGSLINLTKTTATTTTTTTPDTTSDDNLGNNKKLQSQQKSNSQTATNSNSSCINRDNFGNTDNTDSNNINTTTIVGAVDIDTDSGKSSCSPTQFDRSIDSGISGIAEVNDMQLQKRIQQCKRILIALERDKEAYRILRDKLWKIVDKKEKRSTTIEEICNVCCADIHVDDIKSFVTCCTCKKRICRGIKCADWIPKTAQWECQLCHTSKESLAQTSSWVAEQISFNKHKMIYPMRARSEIFIPINDFHHDGSMNFESVSQIGANSAHISAEQKIQIREYVEELVASLLGGSLDKINVGKLSKSENYLPAILNGRSESLEPAATATATETETSTFATNGEQDKNANNLSNISHARLRQLVESIIAETLSKPILINGNAAATAAAEITHNKRHSSGGQGDVGDDVLVNGHASNVKRRHRTEHYFEPRIYQDLLATAVLNKIVDTHGNNNGRRVSESTPDLSGNGQQRDGNFNVENQSTTSGSSVEPRSDCSYSDNEQMSNVDRIVELSPNGSQQNLNADNSLAIGRESVLSDYIATHMVPLPDLSTPATESGSDDQASASSSTLAAAEGTWEDNWLFKKRDSSLSASVTGSAMLVPAPKVDIRAQIGDKAADEVSDLSEMGSETDDSSLDLIRASMDPMNERVLNKHLIGGQNTKIALDELVECASVGPAIEVTNLAETKNTEIKETAAEAINTKISHVKEQQENIQQIEKLNPLTGSIAEREYQKWNNAVDMPNNPYSAEALKKRITSGQERFIDLPNISPSVESKPITALPEANIVDTQTEIGQELENAKRYSRDYYINDGKSVTPSSPTKLQPQTAIVASPTPPSKAEDDIIINEVIPNAIHWTLSTPVRRSSSLKFINQIRSTTSNSNHNLSSNSQINRSNTPTIFTTNTATTTMTSKTPEQYQKLPKRASTSASHYQDDDYDDDNIYDDEREDVLSQQSWRSSHSKRRPNSSLSSIHSTSGGSLGSLNSMSSKKRSLPNSKVLTQFEKQLLHKDLKRNSFRAISSTTKDFVVNPLFEREQFFDGKTKLSLKPVSNQHHQQQQDDQGDSGVDSCLNGFSELEAKNSNNSLLF